MKTIPFRVGKTAEGTDINEPAEPIPEDCFAVWNGNGYDVYKFDERPGSAPTTE